jgi:heterodisulfide reductase subunit A
MECIEACVFRRGKTPDEFNLGLSMRKPVYIPFPQAVPQVVVIDRDACIEFRTGRCKKTCVEVCADRNAIDFKQTETFDEVDVGAIILATGFKTFDAARSPQFGYKRYDAVYTALEIERLVNASGPTEGHVTLRDGRKPKTIGIIHCVGSRDANTNKHCSRVCCMYSLKLAHLLKEKTEAEIYNFYIDMRSAGKDYEEFYNRVEGEGVHFIRGKVASVIPEAGGTGRVVLTAEDTLAGMVRQIPVDMVVLATGLQPQPDAEAVRRVFNISCAGGGFFMERHPKLAPVSTFTDGVFLAGVCQGPKDIPDTVAQAGAAAAEALALVDKGYVEMEPNTAYVVREECSGCKTCIPMCPYTAISRVDGKALINPVLCKGCGTCVAACPSGSIRQNLFEDEMIYEEILGVLADA